MERRISVGLSNDIKCAEARGQAHFAELLAMCFSRPNLDLARSYLSSDLYRTIKGWYSPEEDGTCANYFQPQPAYLALSVEECRLQMEVEYNQLFIGPGRPPAPPYESCYRTDVTQELKGLLMGPYLSDVVRRYESAGITLSPDFNTPADHLVVELDFMAKLSTWEAEAWDEGNTALAQQIRTAQAEFLFEHLVWFEELAELVQITKPESFYALAAELLAQYIEANKTIFK